MICWSIKHYQMSHQDRCAQFASFAFDASVPQTFSPLARGAELHILKDDLRYSPLLANDYFEKNGITYADLPTQFCEQFIRETNNHSLRRATTGGEKLKNAPENINFVLTDEYGPTECTVTATYYDVDGKYSKTPIGKPISNIRVYILDKKDLPVPVGAPGELCVAGAGLARGYLNRPELTAEKFVADPFMPGEKMYRTGDLARWLPDGNIDYLGRIDHQVKIRGFRVELEEIQNEIIKHPMVSDAVIANGKNADGDDFISAHIILKKEADGINFSHERINEFLSKTLPNYMLPSKIMFIDRIPLTSGGKADKKALLAMLPEEGRLAAFVAPSNETEKTLAGIWSELLNVKKIGVTDDFFELGGHSLKAASLQLSVKKAFAVEISLHDIFSAPTIKALAGIIKNNSRTAGSSITRAPERKHYPLSAAQKRLFVMDRISGGKTTYNLTSAFKIRGPLDATRFGNAIRAAIERHSAFGTRFEEVDGEPVAVIEKNVKFKRNYIETNEESAIAAIRDFIKPFDLKRAPLFRILLIKYAEDGHIFVFDAHHIIFDGISSNVFMHEICELYAGRTLEKLEFDYQDYAVWQNEVMPESSSIQKQQDYWLNVFKNDVEPLEIPTSRPRNADISYSGSRVLLNLDGLSNDLEKLSTRCSATNFTTLMALFFVLLHKYSGQSDIVSGVPAAGRENAEFEKTVGMFVNTLAIRSYPEACKPFASFVNEIKNSFVSALDNQQYQFDRLVEKLGLKRMPGRNPLFDVMFAYEDMENSTFKTENIEMTNYAFDAGISKFDLTLFASRGNGSLELSLEYRDSLFERAMAERFLNHFAALLKNAAADPEATIGDIDAMGENDLQKLIRGFNATGAAYPADTTLISLFEKKASESPDLCALVYDGKTMTYSELNEKANRLAWRLKENIYSKNEIFGILLDRSFEMVVSILAALKAGGAYLPIDPSYPAERIEYVISDSGIKTLLTEKKHMAAVSFNNNMIDIHEGTSYSARTENPEPVNSGEDIIYIIYTSGSTGRPKGVMVKHKGALNYIWWCKKVYAEDGACDFPLYSSISFDLTVTSIFTPLICGGKIVIYGEREKETLIDRIIAEDNVDIVKLTPTHLQIIEGMKINCKKIRKFIVGGEDLKADLAMKIFKKFNNKIRIFNEYGPTETTVGCMIYEFSPSDAKALSVPIGIPAANTMIYILGKDLKPVLPGTTGEIYISGDGVARGYLNKSEMTAAKFVSDPFNPERTMYKTGDLARMLPSWNVEFLGRIDDQVKLRGFRIEIGEIE
ncbi:MAG TPA: amino acid adenylation domain-containing protein, partial [Candidatus Wallbacteria bacterium]|nr:amino acid adenylation domain-containing protein [Candidatus Wallbacteria bacterium]